MSKRTLIVVGAGKGLGNAVAREFALHNFRVVLIARNAEHLKTYKREFVAQGDEKYDPAMIAKQYWKMYTERKEYELVY